MVVVGLADLPVLGEVVHPDDLVTPGEELLNDIAADEPGRAADQYALHVHPLWARSGPAVARSGAASRSALRSADLASAGPCVWARRRTGTSAGSPESI